MSKVYKILVPLLGLSMALSCGPNKVDDGNLLFAALGLGGKKSSSSSASIKTLVQKVTLANSANFSYEFKPVSSGGISIAKAFRSVGTTSGMIVTIKLIEIATGVVVKSATFSTVDFPTYTLAYTVPASGGGTYYVEITSDQNITLEADPVVQGYVSIDTVVSTYTALQEALNITTGNTYVNALIWPTWATVINVGKKDPTTGVFTISKNATVTISGAVSKTTSTYVTDINGMSGFNGYNAGALGVVPGDTITLNIVDASLGIDFTSGTITIPDTITGVTLNAKADTGQAVTQYLQSNANFSWTLPGSNKPNSVTLGLGGRAFSGPKTAAYPSGGVIYEIIDASPLTFQVTPAMMAYFNSLTATNDADDCMGIFLASNMYILPDYMQERINGVDYNSFIGVVSPNYTNPDGMFCETNVLDFSSTAWGSGTRSTLTILPGAP